MTLEEKVRMCFGDETPGYVQLYGILRLGIPPAHPGGMARAALCRLIRPPRFPQELD